MICTGVPALGTPRATTLPAVLLILRPLPALGTPRARGRMRVPGKRSLYLGDVAIDEMYVGDLNVTHLYLGKSLVWERWQ